MHVERIQRIVAELRLAIDNTVPLLIYESPFQLLIAVILSAQTTDAQVNKVTPDLFASYPTPGVLSTAPISILERLVHSTGFYRMKAKHIQNAATTLVESFAGVVPNTIDELITIPGVGRKSANVVIGACFGQPAIIVDTHLIRVTNRLGVVRTKDPTAIERELRAGIPEDVQYEFSMLINRHGRATCTARKPACNECVIRHCCDWAGKSGREKL